MAFGRSGKHHPVDLSGDWYYCLKHRTVEQGLQCPQRHRLGPYPSKEAAERALETASDRNAEWDEDPRWNDGEVS